MEEEHAKQVVGAFGLLDRALEQAEWEFVTEKRGVSVSYCAFEGDSVSTFKGEGIIAVVCVCVFLVCLCSCCFAGT